MPLTITDTTPAPSLVTFGDLGVGDIFLLNGKHYLRSSEGSTAAYCLDDLALGSVQLATVVSPRNGNLVISL